MVMLSIRNVGGISLLLAGSTWLWLTPAFASRDVSTTGPLWAVTRLLTLGTVAAFCVATWGLFARTSWWEPVAIASASLGLLALVPYTVAALRGGEAVGTTTWNVFVHVVMVAGVFALLLLPQLEAWVSRHVSST